MKRWFAIVPFMLMACGGKKEPAPPTTAAPVTTAPAADAAAPAPEVDAASAPEADAAAPAPASGACLAKDAFAILEKVSPDHATFADGVATVCGQAEGTGYCYALDLKAPSVTASKQAEDDLVHVPNGVGAIDDPFHRKDGAPALQLCLDPKVGCKDVYVGQTLAATINADKTRFVLATLDDREKKLHVFELPGLTEVSSVVLDKETDLPDCTFGAMLGETLLVSTGPCGADSAGHKAYLAAPASGDKLADIGGADGFDLRYDGYVQVKDALWAFRSADGKKVVVQDVKTGAVQATIDLAAAGAPKATESWLFATAEPLELVVVENRPVAGAVYAFDPMTGKPTRSLVPTACP